MSFFAIKTLVSPNSLSTAPITQNGMVQTSTGAVVIMEGRTMYLTSYILCNLYDTLLPDTYVCTSSNSRTIIDKEGNVKPVWPSTQTPGQITSYMGQDVYKSSGGTTIVVGYNYRVLVLRNIFDIWSADGLSDVEKEYIQCTLQAGAEVYVHNLIVSTASPCDFSRLKIITDSSGNYGYVAPVYYTETNEKGAKLCVVPSGVHVSGGGVGLNVFRVADVFVTCPVNNMTYVSNTGTFASISPEFSEFYQLTANKCQMIPLKLEPGKVYKLKDLAFGKIVQKQGRGVQLFDDYVIFDMNGVLYLRTTNITYRLQC